MITRRGWDKILWLAYAAAVGATCAGGQTAPRPHLAAGGKLYAVAGTLRNSVSEEPIARATVSLLDEETRATIEMATTDSEGGFRLAPVPAGKYGLRAARRGYLAASFDEHDEYSSAIVTGDGQDTEHLPFKLKPEAVIHGVVTDDAGEPVAQAQLQLMRKTRVSGLGEYLTQSIAGMTDDQGNFEFWNLMPGTYLLAVKATPWYALHPPASPNGDNATSSLDVAYPVTYYDGTTDESAAAPIVVNAGDQPEVTVSLHAVPAVRLMVHVPEQQGAGAQRYVGMPMLRQDVLGEDEMVASARARPGPPGSGWVEIDGLAPGHYSVMRGNPPRLTGVDISGSGTEELDEAASVATATVDVTMRMADGSAVPAPLRMNLLSEANRQTRIEGRIDHGQVHFEAVPPGAWTLLAWVNNQSLPVLSIQSEAGTRAGGQVIVQERPLRLMAQLATAPAKVQGFAQKDGKPAAGMMIVLVPHDAANQWQLFRRDQTDSDGSFNLRDVAPGRYTVVAIEDGWDLDWARPEVIGRYLKQGVSVTVSSPSGKIVSLPQAVAVQSR